MATHFAEANRVDPRVVHGTVRHRPASCDDDTSDDDDRPTVARGIAIAGLMSAPFWALFALATYLLL